MAENERNYGTGGNPEAALRHDLKQTGEMCRMLEERAQSAEAEVERLREGIAARDAVIVRYMSRYGRLDRG